MNAHNLQSYVESARQLELLVKDRDHQIGADYNPDLGLQREIHIAAVHEIKSSGFEEKAVEPSHIVLWVRTVLRCNRVYSGEPNRELERE
jgi:hypothetical protein